MAQSLQDSQDPEVFLRSSLDALSAHIAILDATGRIIVVNAAWRAFGQANGLELPDDGLGADYLQACDSAADPLGRRVACGLREMLAGNRPYLYEEYPCHSPDQRRWFALRATSFEQAGERRLVLAHENITLRKLAEVALKESEGRLHRMVEQLPAGAAYAENGRLSLNAAAEEITGYSRSELTTTEDWFRRLYGDQAQAARDRYATARAEGFPEALVERITRRDGSPRSVEFAGHVFAGHVEGEHEVWLLRDITERIALEERLRHAQKMEAIGQLTGGIAHDFNNILMAVIGNLEMLEPELARDRQRLLLGQALEAAETGGKLTGQLLAFARKQALNPQILDLNALILDLGEILRRTLGERIKVRLFLDPDLRRARADPAQVQNALLNLALNARDSMPGGGLLTVETRNAVLEDRDLQGEEDARPGAYVEVTLRDTGAGMPPAIAERAFEPFFTTKELGAGTGLGLSMVYGFLQQSGGLARLDSAPGVGTAVSLYLPVSDPGEAAALQASDVAAPQAEPGETILIVEDDPRVRRVTVGRLEQLGYRVHEAESADTALALLEDGVPADLLFTDVVMPGGSSGWDLARAALGQRPNLKVLFTSGYPDDSIGESEVLGRSSGLLRKPYKLATLAQELRKALES